MESICTNNGVLFDQMPFDDSPISQQPHSSSVVPFLCQSLPHLLVLIIILKKRKKKKKKRERRNGLMGQVLSNILDYILCGEEAEDEPERPSETSQLLISLANSPVLQAKPSTDVSESLLLQTLLSSSPTSDSCSDSSESYVLNPPQEEEEESEESDEEEKVSKAVVIEEKWMQHYSSCQKILLVGEGDFSFSASLAVAFGSSINIFATSLDSEGFLSKNYGSAMSNIQSLRSRGAMVVHGVDATEMAATRFLFEGRTFDRIVYNFPHAGFITNEPRESQLQRHKKLVRLFMANAKRMIAEDGEIHVTHKSNGFFCEWNLRQLGSSEGLRLIEEVHFNFMDYPGYYPKYGFGSDKNFNCDPSKTYKFGLEITDCSSYFENDNILWNFDGWM